MMNAAAVPPRQRRPQRRKPPKAGRARRARPAALPPDVSFRDDAASAAAAAAAAANTTGAGGAIPSSIVPKELQIIKTSPLPPTGDVAANYDVHFDSRSGLFHTVLFPPLRPTSRRDVLILDRWTRSTLAARQRGREGLGADVVEDIRAALPVLNAAMVELVRQVAVHCGERGQPVNDAKRTAIMRRLMTSSGVPYSCCAFSSPPPAPLPTRRLLDNVWRRYVSLHDRLLTRMRETVGDYKKANQSLQLENDKNDAALKRIHKLHSDEMQRAIQNTERRWAAKPVTRLQNPFQIERAALHTAIRPRILILALCSAILLTGYGPFTRRSAPTKSSWPRRRPRTNSCARGSRASRCTATRP